LEGFLPLVLEGLLDGAGLKFLFMSFLFVLLIFFYRRVDIGVAFEHGVDGSALAADGSGGELVLR
jgi:hypothetical protein